MDIRFLLGPAGSGKTFRCLAEVREHLRAAPDGPRLVFLAPKQATFQIERQLLSDPEIPGYTRLQIFSFERLAEFVLSEFAVAPGEVLSEDGRVMVLRALLAEKQSELQLFRATARLPGFAQEISAVLRELQQHQLSPDELLSIAQRDDASSPLREKLHDIALLLRAYRDWLKQNHLHDASSLLDLAAETLASCSRRRESAAISSSEPASLFAWAESQSDAHSALRIPHFAFELWLDGFAEMTSQELNLLAAIIPSCERATLAFCLEAEPRNENASWLSLWSVVAQTYRRCLNRLSAIEGRNVIVEVLERDSARNRFSGNSTLAHLEAYWPSPRQFAARQSTECTALERADSSALFRGGTCPAAPGDESPGKESGDESPHSKSISIATCANPEAEAVLAAREILHFVRERGARFRDAAVLLRTLDGYHDSIRRVFTRYEIPFFLDRRESVTHHPLAELTRFALRTIAFGWKRDDWLGVLKSGLVHRDETELDQLENEALARGWEGEHWIAPLAEKNGEPHRFEPLRKQIVPPFEKLGRTLAGPVSGPQLVAALRELWSDLDAERTLGDWKAQAEKLTPVVVAIHDTVWNQMNEWLDNLERAFRSQLPVSEWLPILEAGLAGLSVGVIPPALDQVLVGTIDRSRNPDLKLVVILGMNETVFPAPPSRASILTENDRSTLADALESKGRAFGLTAKQRLAHERYFGYIACTRARERLVLTCSVADSRGKALNPSPFLSRIKSMFPTLEERSFSVPDWRDAEHACELAAPLIDGQHPQLAPFATLPQFVDLVAKANQLNASSNTTKLAREIVERLYANPLAKSVSALEDFAACPFKFFVKSGLRAKEREEFEVDARQKGSFQHEILSEFHQRVRVQQKHWRDLTVAEARALIREIGREKLSAFQSGLFASDEARRFTAGVLLQNLERLIETLIGWMAHYQFDPQAVELSFGLDDSDLPGWTIDLGNGRALLLRGRIDRIDLCRADGADEALAVVIDYKSSGRKLDATKLFHGLELQLLSYLGWLRQLKPEHAGFPVSKLEPAGVFYVALRGQRKSAPSREDALDDGGATRRKGFQHSGRFNKERATQFDSAKCEEQFTFNSRSDNALSQEAFDALVRSVEEHLKRFGSEILNGVVAVAPFRKGQEVACERCEFSSICRFDPWLDPYRTLKPPQKPATKSKR